MEEELITRWPGLESNPDVMSSFAAKLGLNTSQFSFTDVFVHFHIIIVLFMWFQLPW